MRIAPRLSVLVMLALVCGCARGPKLVLVTGKLSDGGKSVLPNPKDDGLTIVFIPVEGGGTTYPTPLKKEDNTYTVYGPDSKSGIPQGKYKVSLNIMTIHSSPAIDRFNQQFAADKTPIEVEVTEPPLDIDLSKYKK